ncbi:MAG: preprotein translocase subunit SecY [Lachnospiraceae bacterium]|nr:preprotein translocase subunit SecY [Lachnospiraceae bacterium]
MKKSGRNYLFLSKLIYTVMILAVYAIGRSIPLYGVDPSMYDNSLDASMLLEQTIGGDIYKCSVFTLGISPYMLSSILVQIVSASRSSSAKARTSARKTNQLTVTITFLLAMIMAVQRLDEIRYIENGMFPGARVISVLEMIAGAFIIVWLSGRNKRYGIGGQTVLIFINILDGITATLRRVELYEAMIPVIISVTVALVMLFMENSEKRIPLQRISIHNVYADKNYQAIKLNPVGIMPVMFASAAFMLPRLIIDMLKTNIPDNYYIDWLHDNLILTRPLGIAVYIGSIFLLNMLFSFIILSPKDITEQFLKSGDSLVGIHPGKDTRRYLRKHVFEICLFSSFVMGGCVFVSLVMQMKGYMHGTLAMLPTSAMMLMGLWSSLYKEAEAVIHTDSYKTFI